MKKLTLIGIILTLGFSLTLWQKQGIVAAKAPPLATIPVAAGDESALIQAIDAANATPGADTLSLGGGTYSFTAPHNWEFGPNALPIIQSDITIEGNGATIERAVSSTFKFRLFYIAGNGIGSLTAGTLTLRDVTLKGGLAKGGDSNTGGGGMGAGGAIFNHGNVVLDRVTLNNNTAQGGNAGIGTSFNGAGIGGDAVGTTSGGGFGGPPTGTGGLGGAGSTTNGSFGRGGGGGGFLAGSNGGNAGTSPGATVGKGGGLGLLGGKGGGDQGADPGDGGGAWGSSQIVNNGFPLGAGGNYGFGGGNGGGAGGGVGGGGGTPAGGGGFGGGGGGGAAFGGSGGFGGGGGAASGAGGFSGGNATNAGAGGGGGLGGAIFNHQGSLTLINTTLTANLAQGGTGVNNGSGLGGSVFNLNGTVTIANSTIAHNTATDGGALYNLGYGNAVAPGGTTTATVTISNSILANSSGASNDLINNEPAGGSVPATVTLSGANLVMTNATINGATTVGSPTTTVDPQLAPLANNGGLTPTMALTNTSAAFNAGSNALTLVLTDQRGLDRIANLIVDLGAFENQEAQNEPPTITGETIARTQGATGPISTIATVADGVGEDAPGSLTVTVLSAPSGITVSGLTNTNGTITANVAVACNTTPGARIVQLQVEDSGPQTATADLTVNVVAITLPPLPGGGTAGTPYSESAAASPAGAYTYSITDGSLPPTLSLNPGTGLITGTLTTAGTFDFAITAVGGGCSVSRNYQIVVGCPVIALSVLPGGQVGSNYSQTISATPAGTTYSFVVSSGALPPGLTLNPSGAFSGAPTQSGPFNFRVTATGFGICTGFHDYQIVIDCAVITLNPSSLPGAAIGSAYSQSVSATPAATYSFGVTSGLLPPGLTLNPTTGALTGIPTTEGTFSFGITASSGGCSGVRNYTIVIGCQAISITTGSLAAGTVASNYSQPLNVTPGGTYTFSVIQGGLPSGFSINPSTGVISGLSWTAGTSNFTIKARTASGCSATRTLSLTINCPTRTFTPSTLPSGQKGTFYNQAINATPVVGTNSYSFSGSLPPGLWLNATTGVLGGNPTTNGTFNFTVTATGYGCAGSQPYTMTIAPGTCPTITLPAFSGGKVGQLYVKYATPTPGGIHSYSLVGTLPPGMTFYSAIGLLYGYPTAAGSYNFSVTATNVNNCTGTRAYTVPIAP